jgi:legumain
MELASTGKKVLRSNKNSKVFFYFADHAATGLLAFPNSAFLFADDLGKAFRLMHDKGMYEKILIYVEGSESGSLFKGLLPKDLEILGVTASK